MLFLSQRRADPRGRISSFYDQGGLTRASDSCRMHAPRHFGERNQMLRSRPVGHSGRLKGHGSKRIPAKKMEVKQ
jgi:hypothetical protein